MDELELLERARPEPAPAPETVARHRRQLAGAMEEVPAAAVPAPERPRRPARLLPLAGAALVLAGVVAGLLTPGGEDSTQVVVAPPAAQATSTTPTTARGGIVPCGSGLPVAIPVGPNEHDPGELDPTTVSVRIYACRLDRQLPETLTGPDGRVREMVTTLRELTDRFGGPEGSVLDEFGQAHAISLAPLAGADPDTTVVGLVWSGRRRDAPPPPSGLPQPPPTSLSLLPPWVESGRR
jgi:hypothetical protein